MQCFNLAAKYFSYLLSTKNPNNYYIWVPKIWDEHGNTVFKIMFDVVV